MTSLDTLSPVTGGWWGCLGTKMQCVPPPRPGRGWPSQMWASPLIHQLLRLGPVLPPLFWGLLGQGKRTGKEC